jgi:hypothetical protein
MRGKIFKPLVQATSWGLAVVLVLIAMLGTEPRSLIVRQPLENRNSPSQSIHLEQYFGSHTLSLLESHPSQNGAFIPSR